MSTDTQPTNPYAPPQTDGGADAEAERLANLAPAGLGLRFANLIIDYVGCFIVQVIVFAVMTVVSPTTNPQDMSLVVGLSTLFGYYAVLESTANRTLGKLITGTRVVRFDGYKPTFPQIIGRTFARFIPFEPFSFLGGSGTGWHDSLSGTRVVRVRG